MSRATGGVQVAIVDVGYDQELVRGVREDQVVRLLTRW